MKVINCEIVLQSHNNCLLAIEKELNMLATNNKLSVLKLELPLKTIDDLQEFEDRLIIDERQSVPTLASVFVLMPAIKHSILVHFLRRISGSGATICSWNG